MKKMMMIAAMLVATVSANAQFEPGTFSLQPKLGVSASWLSNMPNIQASNSVKLDKSPVAGFLIGCEAEYQLTNMLSLAAGLNYSLQGSGWDDYEKKEGNITYKLKDSKIELGYITLPVVANVYLFKGFAIKGGVQFGFLTNANEKLSFNVSGSSSNLNIDMDESIKDECEKLDISIPMGVSYQVPTIPIVIDARYNLGLTRLNKEKEDKNYKNNVIQLTVGYKFKL